MTPRVCIIRQRDYYELPVRREAETLRDAGYRVDVICLRQEGHPDLEEDDGVLLHRLPTTRKKGSRLQYVLDYVSFFVLAAVKVTQLDRRERFAAVQVNTMPDFLAFAALVPRLRGAKVVVFMKEPTPELAFTLYGSTRMRWLLERIEQLVLRYADAAFTVSEQLKDTYVSRGADPRKIRVVLNGPDARHLLDVDVSAEPDPTRFTLVCHGSIEEHYGHDTILRAVALARAEVPGLRLTITGSGGYVDQVHALIDELDLHDCVDFHGWVTERELVTLLRQADVGVVAQKANPYSHLVHTNKMFEYIILDKPVIASRLRAVEGYFDDDSIRFFEPDDPASLRDAIVDLYRRPEERASLVAAARDRYRAYNWDQQAAVLLETYRDVLGGEGRATATLLQRALDHARSGTLLGALTRRVRRTLFGAPPVGDSYYGPKARDYEGRRTRQHAWDAEQRVVADLLRTLPDEIAVLDVPFGTGRFLPYYREKRMRVFGLDSSPEMIDQARAARGADALAACEIQIGDARHLPYEDDAFDLVVCFRFLSEIVSFADARQSLREIARVTRSHAILDLGARTPGRASGRQPDDHEPVGDQLPDADVRAVIEEAGLTPVRAEPMYGTLKGTRVAYLCTLAGREGEPTARRGSGPGQ